MNKMVDLGLGMIFPFINILFFTEDSTSKKFYIFCCDPKRMRLHKRLYVIFFSPFSCIWDSLQGKNRLICMLNHLANHQNTEFNQETKNQASNCHTFRFFIVFTVSSVVGNPEAL